VFSAPYRLLTSLRPNVRLGILVAAAASSVVFVATPFLVTAVVDDFGIGLGLASSISTAQLFGFVGATWLSGRYLTPSRRIVVASVLFLFATNALSAVAPTFGVLVGLRGLAGVALGLITWIAWSEAAGSTGRMRDVAVVGPLTGAVAAPVLSWAAESGGVEMVYLLLAVIAAVPLLFRTEPSTETSAKRGRRRPAVPAAKIILAALFALTAGGSAVFVYAAAIALEQTNLSAATISLAFSANAIASIPAARLKGVRRLGGLGYLGTAACALLVGLTSSGLLFFLGLTLWGAAFWYATPATHALLEARSRYPQERVGDAQALMAAGRVLGPLMGGIAVGAGSIQALSLLGAGFMAAAGLAVIVVELFVKPLDQATL